MTPRPVDELRTRAAAAALLARLLGPDTAVLRDPELVEATRWCLAHAGCDDASGLFDRFDPATLPSGDELAGWWVRWFDLGRIAPYEGSNVGVSAGGVTPRLADVAGFYRAFGFAVRGDRPDHVVAELEFLAMCLMAEAEARAANRHADADNTAAATRSFLRDHAGTWIEAWANRLAEIPEASWWFPIAAAAARLVHDEATLRNVIPLRDGAALPGICPVADDDEPLLQCTD